MSKQGKSSESFGSMQKNPQSKSPTRAINPNHHTKLQKDPAFHLGKVNSSALLKKKSLKRIKTISPLIGKSPSYSVLIKNQKSSLSKKPSLKAFNNLPGIIASYRSVTPTKTLNISAELETSEETMRKPQQKKLNFTMMVDKYEMYKGIFDEIIEKDKNFSQVLKKIKDAYEEFYSASIEEHTKKLREKCEVLNEILSQHKENQMSLEKKVKKLASENYDLAKSLERSEEICNCIQERLIKISKFDINKVPQDEETWKSLVIENEAYSISFKNLESKLKNSRKNEGKLRRLIEDIRESGFRVDKFIEKSMQGRNQEKAHEFNVKPMYSETSESDYLISQRGIIGKKNEKIPGLDLDKVPPVSISSNNSYSDYSIIS